jgi:hypothetical protein
VTVLVHRTLRLGFNICLIWLVKGEKKEEEEDNSNETFAPRDKESHELQRLR